MSAVALIAAALLLAAPSPAADDPRASGANGGVIADGTVVVEGNRIVALLRETGALGGVEELAAIGHRVVHGGERFSQPTIITREVLETIESLGRDTVVLGGTRVRTTRKNEGLFEELAVDRDEVGDDADDLSDLDPIISLTGSDSSSLDNMLDVLLTGGIDMPRALRTASRTIRVSQSPTAIGRRTSRRRAVSRATSPMARQSPLLNSAICRPTQTSVASSGGGAPTSARPSRSRRRSTASLR